MRKIMTKKRIAALFSVRKQYNNTVIAPANILSPEAEIYNVGRLSGDVTDIFFHAHPYNRHENNWKRTVTTKGTIIDCRSPHNCM